MRGIGVARARGAEQRTGARAARAHTPRDEGLSLVKIVGVVVASGSRRAAAAAARHETYILEKRN